MFKNVLIIDEMHSSIVPGLERIGLTADYQPSILRNEILDVIENYEGMIVRSKTNADREMLDKAVNLKYIARAGAGTDKIDDKLCEKKGIVILNAPEGNRDALGEHALGILLSLLNKIHTSDHEIRHSKWDREGNRGYEVLGKTVGIIGYGNMGGAFAQRLCGFGCKVLAYDKYKTGYGDQYVEESSMDDLFNETDILSFHVPLTPETNGFYNYGFFHNFRKDLILINSARGQILPLKDLIRLMDEGKVTGAALDVLENEKIDTLQNSDNEIFNNLISRSNVVFTPHVGGWSYESYERINTILIEKIKNFYDSLGC
ncbi:NAD(P)-dependent oxidoreductase [Bacteroidota bacterium]